MCAVALTAAACGGAANTGDVRVAAGEELGAAGAHAVGTDAAVAPTDTLVVYKTPTCGCCNDWVDHVKENGFAVVTQDLNDLTETKRQLRVPAGRFSCHTATVRGYTIEGHVPADLIHRLISENPRGARGLAVPGMPMGSPGMEGLFKQDYEVLLFDDDGNVQVYAER
ncbi:MAG: DUF411 domain-containing protein [Gemmatimonadetes bacterium]|nr:DUF411 domain-containing protein [Gemmatimonadota bacterium]